MPNISISYKLIIQSVFLFSLFISTGAVLDFLVLGTPERNLSLVELNPNNSLRTLTWLPVYLFFVVFIILYIKQIIIFFKGNSAFFILLLMTVLSLVWSVLPSLSIYSSLQMVLLTFFAIVVGFKFSPYYLLQQLYYLFTFIIALSLLYVLILPEYGLSTYAGETSIRGVFTEKNRLGQMLVYYYCLSFIFLKKRLIDIGIFTASFYLLAGNGSATALVLALLLPLIYFSSKFFYGKKDKIVINFIFITAIIFISILLILFSYQYILEWLGKDPTLTGRTDIWLLGLEMISNKLLLGYGYNAFWQYSGGGEYVQHKLFWGPMSMHNGWLEILVQIGTIGFLLMAFIFIKMYSLIIYSINNIDQQAESRATFTIITVLLIWSMMQHLLLRHQEFSHYLVTTLFASFYFQKLRHINLINLPKNN